MPRVETPSQYMPMMNHQPPQTYTESDSLPMSRDAMNSMHPLQNYPTDFNTSTFPMDQSTPPLDNFQAELASYLQGDTQLGMSDDWSI